MTPQQQPPQPAGASIPCTLVRMATASAIDVSDGMTTTLPEGGSSKSDSGYLLRNAFALVCVRACAGCGGGSCTRHIRCLALVSCHRGVACGLNSDVVAMGLGEMGCAGVEGSAPLSQRRTVTSTRGARTALREHTNATDEETTLSTALD